MKMMMMLVVAVMGAVALFSTPTMAASSRSEKYGPLRSGESRLLLLLLLLLFVLCFFLPDFCMFFFPPPSVVCVFPSVSLTHTYATHDACGCLVSLQPEPQSGVNGGTDCAVCTIVIGLTEQYAELHNATASEAFAKICSILPSKLQGPCKTLVEDLGPCKIQLLFDSSKTIVSNCVKQAVLSLAHAHVHSPSL